MFCFFSKWNSKKTKRIFNRFYKFHPYYYYYYYLKYFYVILCFDDFSPVFREIAHSLEKQKSYKTTGGHDYRVKIKLRNTSCFGDG